MVLENLYELPIVSVRIIEEWTHSKNNAMAQAQGEISDAGG